ncbi:Hypothetical_protein [Hexamita inflata]|uniref:Hypothetical_protein n=1 Tax=Hexamita inflata TaxID=28002 RepID=A0AA86NSC3_9EUKA|nr:Hypothetical protein HINF_LOCUS12748 [Hexamita inflata]
MEIQNSNIDDAQDNWKILMTKLCSQFNTVDQHDKSDFSQDITEQQLIDSFKSQIKDNKLIILFNSKLQNIEFVNDFDIETLTIYNCENVIPKINNPRIKYIYIYILNLITAKQNVQMTFNCQIQKCSNLKITVTMQKTFYKVQDNLRNLRSCCSVVIAIQI